MDKTAKLFDVWANTGRSEDMEKGHGTTVNQFQINYLLKKILHFLTLDVEMAGQLGKYLKNHPALKLLELIKVK